MCQAESQISSSQNFFSSCTSSVGITSSLQRPNPGDASPLPPAPFGIAGNERALYDALHHEALLRTYDPVYQRLILNQKTDGDRNPTALVLLIGGHVYRQSP